MFLLHYGYRSFLYPLYLQDGKSTPGLVWLAAVAFVAFNGLMQVQPHVLNEDQLQHNSRHELSC